MTTAILITGLHATSRTSSTCHAKAATQRRLSLPRRSREGEDEIPPPPAADAQRPLSIPSLTSRMAGNDAESSLPAGAVCAYNGVTSLNRNFQQGGSAVKLHDSVERILKQK